MESEVAKSGGDLQSMSLEKMNEYWDAAKKLES
jgi:uncharacterized protein YabN with tetrapyrrole methylase and pyrophosphatase domain